jgi:hypothetical protein
MRSIKLAALAAVLFSLAVQAAAATGPPLPRGPEIRVSTSTSVSQSHPSVAVFPDGGFVVVWTAGSAVRARFFDRQGNPAGGERPLGMAGTVDQAVADRDGTFLVVWTGSTAARPSTNVYVRRFNRDGTPRGNAIRANVPSSYNRFSGVAAIGPDGRFVVAWSAVVPLEETGEPSYTDAVGRIFTAQGTPVTREITLRKGRGPSFPFGDDQTDAFPTGLALAPNGTLIALLQDLGSYCLISYLKRFPAGSGPNTGPNIGPGTGPILGPPICGPDTLGSGLAMGVDGSVVAVWSAYDIEAQRFSPSGAPRGQYFAVSQAEAGLADAAVALQAGGSFVVVWTAYHNVDGNHEDVFGRAFTANGTPRTGDFLISTTTAGNQFSPSIAAARQGPVVVAWTQKLDPNGRSEVFVRVLSAEP